MAENNTGKFKVGDKVKVLSYIANDCVPPALYIGCMGVIKGINEKDDMPYLVGFNGDSWYYTEKDLELIIDTQETKINDTPVSSHDDPVNHPSHYNQSSIECIDAIEAAINGLDGFEGHCTGTSMKYIWRWKFKNGAEDIKKSIWYLQKLLKYEEAKENK